MEATSDRNPVKLKLSVVKGFRSLEIKSCSQQYLSEGSTVISDGLPCFNAVAEAGCSYNKVVCDGGRASAEEPEFYWVNTLNEFAEKHLSCDSAQIRAALLV